MLKLQVIREQKTALLEGLRKRNWSDEDLQLIDEVIRLDDHRKSVQSALDDQLADRNRISKQIGDLMKAGKRDEAEAAKAQIADIKQKAESLNEDLKNTKVILEDHLLSIPNLPHSTVPAGSSENDNEVYRDWEAPLPALPEGSLPHWELAKKYNLFDFELGAKITGAGFPLYRGAGARLQRALINYFLDKATQVGYEEILPPHLVNMHTAKATGQLPDKEGQMYYVSADDLYLIPTAEVPVTNIYRDVILSEEDFPILMTGYTPCFRREAGSYGSDVKGLNRVHQFDKVEIVRIEHPDRSYAALEEMLAHVSHLLTELELPYRILRLCGGDLGFTSALTFDFEVYSAAQQRWLEVSSVSNFETYQTNRLKLRYKTADGSTRLAHTLNGSALALARIVAAILELYQDGDGIRIPAVLVPYTGFERIK